MPFFNYSCQVHPEYSFLWSHEARIESCKKWISLSGLLTMSALIPLVLNRIRIEERRLTDEFRDAYLTYTETPRKLICVLK